MFVWLSQNPFLASLWIRLAITGFGGNLIKWGLVSKLLARAFSDGTLRFGMYFLPPKPFFLSYVNHIMFNIFLKKMTCPIGSLTHVTQWLQKSNSDLRVNYLYGNISLDCGFELWYWNAWREGNPEFKIRPFIDLPTIGNTSWVTVFNLFKCLNDLQ